MKSKKFNPRHIIIKQLKTKNKVKILKAARKNHCIYEENNDLNDYRFLIRHLRGTTFLKDIRKELLTQNSTCGINNLQE